MNWQLSNKACTLYLEFRKDGEFVIPDAGSIKFTLRGNSGALLVNAAAVPDPNSSVTTVVVAQANNTTTVGTIESRYVLVEFMVAGQPLTITFAYRLSDFLPITAQPQDVRNALGVRFGELQDRDVDLYEAYYNLVRSYPLLATALVTSDTRAMNANRAIVLYCALDLIPSMPTRTAKQDSLNNATLLRQTIDWESIQAKLQGELSEALAGLNLAVSTTVSVPTYFTVITPTDVITNA